ncbi:MAG: hypothetical protein E6H58_13510 [Betaproteobacteria bacterium]|nr:MAG: hypothetical protein E6H58_13510 [Betaproteobacteria bacterium]
MAESETNWSLPDSGISGLQIRIVQIKEIAYVEPTGDNAVNDVWDEMVNPNGLLKQLHQWRDDFGADVVILVPDMSGFSGSTGGRSRSCRGPPSPFPTRTS